MDSSKTLVVSQLGYENWSICCVGTAEVNYESCDIRSRKDVGAMLKALKALGPVQVEASQLTLSGKTRVVTIQSIKVRRYRYQTVVVGKGAETWDDGEMWVVTDLLLTDVAGQ